MPSNRQNVSKFTKLMEELLMARLPLDSALKLLSEMKGVSVEVRTAANEIREMLESGFDFSFALKSCSSVRFSDEYVSFVRSSQEGGSLQSTFEFLLRKEKRQSEVKEKLFLSSVYPFIVMVFAVVGSVLLCLYGDRLAVDFSGNFDSAEFKRNAAAGCMKANLFLIGCVFAFVFLLKKISGENLKLDFYCVLNFMTRNGMDLFTALKHAIPVAEKNNNLKKRLMDGIFELEKGEEVSVVLKSFGKECESYLELAQMTGNVSSAFEQIINSIERKQKRTEKLMGSLLEPGVMCVLAVYLCILILDVLAPVMFTFTF